MRYHAPFLPAQLVLVFCLLWPSRVQRPDHYEVTAEVPGFTKDQVNVEVHEVSEAFELACWRVLTGGVLGC